MVSFRLLSRVVSIPNGLNGSKWLINEAYYLLTIPGMILQESAVCHGGGWGDPTQLDTYGRVGFASRWFSNSKSSLLLFVQVIPRPHSSSGLQIMVGQKGSSAAVVQDFKHILQVAIGFPLGSYNDFLKGVEETARTFNTKRFWATTRAGPGGGWATTRPHWSRYWLRSHLSGWVRNRWSRYWLRSHSFGWVREGRLKVWGTTGKLNSVSPW